MTKEFHLVFIKGDEYIPDILSVYECDNDIRKHVNTINGSEVIELLSIVHPNNRFNWYSTLQYFAYFEDYGDFNYELGLRRRMGNNEIFTAHYEKFEALHLYRKLIGATDNIRDMWPGTIIRETHNPYMDKNYFVPARHCGRSAAMMMVDELDDYFKKTKIPKMYIKHEPKFTLENCLGNEVRHYIEEDVKATTELFNNIYNGRAVSFGTLPKIEKVLFNAPATIVFWKDGTKTVVKAQGDDEFDPEKGLAMAICKKALGNDRDYYEVFLKHVGRYEKQQRKAQEMLEKLGECANKGYLDSLADGMKRFAEAARQVAQHMPGDSHDS